LIYGTSTIVGRFLQFLLVPLYTNIFVPGEFGIIANIYAYIAMLNVLFSIGLESGYFKFASTLEVGTRKENFSLPFLTVCLNAFVLSSILFFFSSDFTHVFQIDIARQSLIKYTALILFFDAIVLVPFAYLRLNNKPKIFALIKIINIIINVSLNVILIVFLKYGIEAVFISNIIASALTFIILLPIIIKNLQISFNKALLIELFKFSLPYIPAGISSNVDQVISRPILTYLTDEKTVGIFQANYKLGIFMMLFVSMFDFAWRPFFLNNAKEKNAKQLFSKVMTMFILTASTIFLVLSVFINNIGTMKIPFKGHLIGEAYWSGLNIVPVILLGYLFYGIFINLMAGIYIEKKTKYLPLITGGGAITSVITNFLLIPVLGMMGAAIASLISYTVMTIGIYIVAQKFYRIEYEFKKILILFISLGSCYLIFILTNSMLGDHWYLKSVYVIIFVILVFSMRILDFEVFRKLKIIP
jgi:O-antigen/teichoic acid export membrane protein